jgi:excinuclease ABC subunit A
VLIEHNVDVIKLADWIIDLGPEAGSGGGEVVAMGRPEEIAQVAASHTGRWLKAALDGPAAAAKKTVRPRPKARAS